VGLDIWFKDDIANILRAADEANLSALEVSEGTCMPGAGEQPSLELRCAYRRGFVAALVTLALALGLPPPGAGNALAVSSKAGTGGREWRLAPPSSLTGGAKWEE